MAWTAPMYSAVKLPKRPSVSGKWVCQILHLIGNVYEPEDHIERCPEGCNVLCFDPDHEHVATFKPAAGHGTGIYFISKFRDKCPRNLLCMRC